MKTDQQGDILHVDVCLLQQCHAAGDARFADEGKHRHARLFAEHQGQLFAVGAHAAGDLGQVGQAAQVVENELFDGIDEHQVGMLLALAGRDRDGQGAVSFTHQPQVDMNARGQFFRCERLRNVVDTAHLQAHDAFLGGISAAEKDDGYLFRFGIGLEQSACRVAIHLGHAHIEQDQVG